MARNISREVIRFIQYGLQFLGIRIIRIQEYVSDKRSLGRLTDYRRWSTPTDYPKLRDFVLENMEKSHAQLQQDLVAQFIFNSDGNYFVEFGATDGVSLSNTYLLEKSFNWKGILAEPGKKWSVDLKRNRKVAIDFRAVAGNSGEIRRFKEAQEGEYSTLIEFSKSGTHTQNLKDSTEYTVKTVSLNDLLFEHNAPSEISMISIDTEGSEFEILSNFDFELHNVEVFFVEHNYSENKSKIESLLLEKGYLKFLEEISDFDGWYIKRDLAQKLR